MSSSPRASGRSVNAAQLVSLFLVFLMVAGLGGVLASGFAMPLAAAVGATTSAGAQVFEDLDTELGDQTLSEQSRIRYSDGEIMATFYLEDRIVVPLDQINPLVGEAVIAIEDERFYEHGAIDPVGMLRAVVTNLSSSDLQGASTLTQQYVKNVLLEQAKVNGDPEAVIAATETTIGRKLREAKLAIALEQQYSKDQILEGYLNIAQFGPSQYGVQAAANFFFSKDAIDLDAGEAALLAGITQSPAQWNPITNPENAFNRRNTVLNNMQQQGYISQEDFDTYSEEPIEDMLDVSRTPPTCAVAENSAYFCDYVVATILQSPEFGETRDERYELLMRGGLDITTTLNSTLQEQAWNSLTGAVPVDDASGISNAISTVQPNTGRIVAMAQNTPYGRPNADSAAARTTQVNFNGDSQYGGSQGFQTGSTFKAFLLAAWLEQGRSLMERVNGSSGQTWRTSDWDYSGCTSFAPGPDYSPGNIEGTGGPNMTVLEATRQSVNTAYIDMAAQLNMCEVYDLTQRLGLHVGVGIEAQSGLPLNPSPAMVLGANNIAPVTMAAAFAAFAANGTYCSPIAIDSVTDPDGTELPVPSANCNQAFSPEIAAGVNHALQEVVGTGPGGTGFRADLADRPVAGKTGTANNDAAAWFIGSIPQLTTAVWFGYSDDLRSMTGQVINGVPYGAVYGGALAAPVWNTYMSGAIDALALPPQGFPEVGEQQLFGDRRPVPSVAGMGIDQARATLEGAGFNTSVGGRQNHNSVPAGVVIGTGPGAGSLQLPGTNITIVPSGGPPPPPPPPPPPAAEPSDEPSDGEGGDGGGEGGGGEGGGGEGGGGEGGGEGDN